MYPRAQNRFPSPQGWGSMLTLEGVGWAGQWWSPAPPSGRGHGYWAPSIPKWPRTAAGLRCLWLTYWQNLLSEKSKQETIDYLWRAEQRESEGGTSSKLGAHLRNTRHWGWKVLRIKVEKQEMHGVNTDCSWHYYRALFILYSYNLLISNFKKKMASKNYSLWFPWDYSSEFQLLRQMVSTLILWGLLGFPETIISTYTNSHSLPFPGYSFTNTIHDFYVLIMILLHS